MNTIITQRAITRRVAKIITAAVLSFCIFNFESNCSAQYTKLLDFAGAANGSYPYYGSFISDGTFLYGMTFEGGAFNWGTIFKIMPDGTNYAKLYDFAGNPDGSYPQGGSLISDGTFLYGMTWSGGTSNLGTIFKIMPNGAGYAKLYDFTGNPDGRWPYGSLISDGAFLYGMTRYGGTSDKGTIFKIDANGAGYAKLHDFLCGTSGCYPAAGSLISDGTFLYGMTWHGGTNDMGTIFKIMPNGTGYAKMHDFTGNPDVTGNPKKRQNNIDTADRNTNRQLP